MHHARSGVGLPAKRCRYACTIRTVCVVLTALVLVPLSAAQTREEPAVEEGPAALSMVGEPSPIDLQRLVSPVMQNAPISRLSVSAGGGQVASVGEVGQLVYSNTRGPFAFGPSGEGGKRIADDIVTTAVAGCSLDRYVIRVTGDRNGIGDTRPFTVSVALYDSCPGVVRLPLLPTPIAHTECEETFVPTQAGELHDLECVIPLDLDVPLPSTLYVAVTFDRGNVGWVVGAPAEQGFSADQFDFPGFPCAASLGGFPQFPHASFFAKIFVRGCVKAFPAYRNTKQSGSAFTPGRLIRFGDDITLSVSDCNMVAYEVSVKGSCSNCSGAFLFDLKTALSDSDPATGNQIPGTDMRAFAFTDRVQVFHFDIDPPVRVPQSFFITFATGSDVVGPIVTGLPAAIGETLDRYVVYQGTAPTGQWVFQDFGDRIWSAFDVTIFCEGDPPAGACCDTIFTDEDGEAVCSELPEMNCPFNQWMEAEVCDPDPFSPGCGLGACCRPDDTCENLTLNECNAVEPVELDRLWSRLKVCETPGWVCPFNACLQRDDECGLAHSGTGCWDPFCCTDVCEFDPFCCTVEWDRACLRLLDELCRFTFPTYDQCDGPTEERGALEVQANDTVVISNLGAKSGEIEFLCDNDTPRTPGFRTVWFMFEATETSTRISTCGSDPTVEDTLIQVFRAIDGSSRETACNSLEAIACNDDTDVCDTNTLSSVCATRLEMGETYYVKVGGKTDEDVGVLHVDFHSPCAQERHVVNDECRVAESIGVGTTPFDLTGATLESPGPSCGDATVNDVWYEWTAPVTGLATISSCSAADDAMPQTALAVYEGCDCPVDEDTVLCGELEPRSCPDGSRVQFPTSRGVCYKIRISSAPGGAQFGELSVKFTACPVSPIQCLQQQKLTASDAGGRDSFGRVSVSGETAVVGAPVSGRMPDDSSGAAYVFRFDGVSWVEEQKLTASDPESSDFFGWSVSVSGDTAVIGAPYVQCPEPAPCGGAAYVFRFNGTSWVEEQKLTSSSATVGDRFGRSVSVSGDLVLVGALLEDCRGGDDCGAAYVFRFDGTSWVEERKFTASVFGAGNLFGASVSVSGDTALVGSLFEDCEAGDNCGAAHVFRYNGFVWRKEQKLTASDSAAGDLFGRSVALSGDMAMVGAIGDDCKAGANCGAAYMFRFRGHSWVEEQKLTASDAAADDLFGIAVSVSGDTAVVGTLQDDCAAGDECGSAYAFRFDGNRWGDEQKLTDVDAGEHDAFGRFVSVSGDTVIVGASGDDCEVGDACGSAYVFSCAPIVTVANLDIKPGDCPNSVNPRSQGVVPVAILGCSDFDVSIIDPDSLTLARADGVGEAVSPVENRHGPKIEVADVATPFEGEPCACHDFAGDGLDDLTLKFSTAEMARAFELNGLSKGETIELVLRGTLQDGTNFEAKDCITIPGSRRSSSKLRRTGRSK